MCDTGQFIQSIQMNISHIEKSILGIRGDEWVKHRPHSCWARSMISNIGEWVVCKWHKLCCLLSRWKMTKSIKYCIFVCTVHFVWGKTTLNNVYCVFRCSFQFMEFSTSKLRSFASQWQFMRFIHKFMALFLLFMLYTTKIFVFYHRRSAFIRKTNDLIPQLAGMAFCVVYVCECICEKKTDNCYPEIGSCTTRW